MVSLISNFAKKSVTMCRPTEDGEKFAKTGTAVHESTERHAIKLIVTLF